MSLPQSSTRRLMLGGVLLTWLIVVIGGWLGLSAYAQRAGASSAAPLLVEDSATSTKRYRLLMFVHPKCACSASSMRELERTLARCNGQISAEIYFYRPPRESDNWAHTSLWNIATAIPGVTVHVDPNGTAARSFAVKTSGSVLLYDADGRLCFQGGLTPARGHEGDSAGKAAILAIAHGRATSAPDTRVFGCSLSGEHSLPGVRPRGD